LTLLKLRDDHDVVVLEVGTNHFGEVKYLAQVCLPNIGVITNIGPSHLEFLHNLKGVLNEKYKLIESLKNPSIAILNADDELLIRKVVKKTKNPFILGFGIKNNADFSATDTKISAQGLKFAVNLQHKFILKTLGYHNIYNALVAIAVGRIFGLKYQEIASRLANFDFPAGRLKLIKLDKIKFIDDTYNSNPLSLKQALDVLGKFNIHGRKILVMGDMLELGSRQSSFHFQAGCQAAKICDALITVGKLSKLTADAAKECGFNIRNIFTCESCRDARDILFNKISPRENDIVLVKGSRAMKMEEIFKDR
jgi:UDP-N-acetylmuramoyl-tripeptide--D-alanyl-D-alanine ligase